MKAQSTTLDLIIALALLAIVAPVFITLILEERGAPATASLAFSLSESIMNPYPVIGMNDTSVIVPGFVVDNRYDPDLFNNFTALDPAVFRQTSGITVPYFINISNSTGSIQTVGLLPIDADALSAVTRYAAFEGEIIRIEVMVWQ